MPVYYIHGVVDLGRLVVEIDLAAYGPLELLGTAKRGVDLLRLVR
jgi:hypothetical protein